MHYFTPPQYLRATLTIYNSKNKTDLHSILVKAVSEKPDE